VVVFFVGIHGNEIAGVEAFDRMEPYLREKEGQISGTVYVLTGNLPALEAGVRYLDTDLNRLWEVHPETDRQSHRSWLQQTREYQQYEEIKKEIDGLLVRHSEAGGEFIFADIHTTSARSCPFVLLNDTLSNRQLAKQFPAPRILGIERHIRGTILSYINNLGHTAIGFEAGRHSEPHSVDRSEAFIRLMLHHTGILKLQRDLFTETERILEPEEFVPPASYTIKYHRVIENAETFQMIPGFRNFDLVERNRSLAYENGKVVKSPVAGRIFMPLYQKRGHDGFFIIREVSAFWLELSAWLKNNFSHSILRYLPGVKPYSPNGYLVNMDNTLVGIDDLFHLLGYRISYKDEDTIICYRR